MRESQEDDIIATNMEDRPMLPTESESDAVEDASKRRLLQMQMVLDAGEVKAKQENRYWQMQKDVPLSLPLL